ncbi:hypothetical protein ACM55H_01880 [Flavobacterium sp. ZT3R17]|uniref:hypothetical protein n=1 Tax=Flavobacterium cryoconiti TaxID=3398736 RepID=UPI003A8B9F19
MDSNQYLNFSIRVLAPVDGSVVLSSYIYYRMYFASSNHPKLGAILPFQTYDQIHLFKETANGLSLQCFISFAIESFLVLAY